jgi:hypothetical protein
MTNEVKVKLSGGLFVLAGLQVLGLMIVMFVFHPMPNAYKAPTDSSWKPPRVSPVNDSPTCPPNCNCGEVGAIVSDNHPRLIDPPQTNVAAQHELKQAGCRPCVNRATRKARSTTIHDAPSQVSTTFYPALHPVVTHTYHSPVAVSTPTVTNVSYPAAQPALGPSNGVTVPAASPLAQPITSAQKAPAQKKYQVALFVDSTNHPLVAWFSQHPKLLQLRQQSDFQVYTPTSRLYQTRYAGNIPVSQFPLVLVQDQRGGHIHAAGGPMIPPDPDTLWNDIYDAHELYEQAMQAPIESSFNGAYRTAGYKFDQDILPSLRLDAAIMQNVADCPDGFCEPDQVSGRDGFFPNLFNRAQTRAKDSAEALVWAGTVDIAAVFLMLAILVLGIMAAVKHLSPRD